MIPIVEEIGTAGVLHERWIGRIGNLLVVVGGVVMASSSHQEKEQTRTEQKCSDTILENGQSLRNNSFIVKLCISIQTTLVCYLTNYNVY